MRHHAPLWRCDVTHKPLPLRPTDTRQGQHSPASWPHDHTPSCLRFPTGFSSGTFSLYFLILCSFTIEVWFHCVCVCVATCVRHLGKMWWSWWRFVHSSTTCWRRVGALKPPRPKRSPPGPPRSSASWRARPGEGAHAHTETHTSCSALLVGDETSCTTKNKILPFLG